MNSEMLRGTGAKHPLTKVVVIISKSTEMILGKLYGGQETKTESCEVVVGRRHKFKCSSSGEVQN